MIFLTLLVPISEALEQRIHSIIKTQAEVEYEVPDAPMLKLPL